MTEVYLALFGACAFILGFGVGDRVGVARERRMRYRVLEPLVELMEQGRYSTVLTRLKYMAKVEVLRD